MKERIVFGSDIGGVIIDRANDGTDTSFFGDNFLHTTEVVGAFDALRQLNDATRGPKGECNVFLVSACGAATQEKTLQLLGQLRFFERTGIPLGNVHFCRRLADEVPICADLGITHFIDDRLEVLGSLTSVKTKFLFRPDSDEVVRFMPKLTSVRVADSWDDVASFILH